MTTARSILAGLALALAGSASAGERCSAISGDTLGCGRERVLVEGLRAPLDEPGAQEAAPVTHLNVVLNWFEEVRRKSSPGLVEGRR